MWSDETQLSHIVVWPAQFNDAVLPVPLLSKQLVDLIVEVPDPKLTKTSWCKEQKERILDSVPLVSLSLSLIASKQSLKIRDSSRF